MAKVRRPKDTNQLAKLITDIATGETEDTNTSKDELKSAAALLGRMGGLKGGKARASKLSPEERSRIAKKAAQKRWDKDSNSQ